MFKVLLLGSGDLARGVLEGILATQHQLVGFYPWEARTAPTLKTRIKRYLVPDNVAFARERGVPLLQMRSANSAEFVERVTSLAPDIIVVAGWGEILRADIVGLPVTAFVNCHPSLLPRHRGASPIASVLREGERETGVTFHYLTAKIDAGNILFQSGFAIFDYDDYASLSRRIAYRAKETVGLALAGVGQEGSRQEESQASYFYRPQPGELWLNWQLPAAKLRDRVRSAFRNAYFLSRHGDQALQLLDAELVELHTPCDQPGKVLDKVGTRLLIATGDQTRALFVCIIPVGNRLGPIGAKLYALNRIQVGDVMC